MDYALLLLCLFSFLAGFIDSVAGGGGLVQVPAFFVLYPHLLVPNIIGTNRLASLGGTSVAAWTYLKNVKVPWPPILAAAAGAAVFAYVGALVQSHLPATVLKPTIFFLILAIAVYTYVNKGFGQEEQLRFPTRPTVVYAGAVGAVMGFYNGCIGPGTGTLLVFGLVRVLGFSFLRASAMSKVINATADVFSLIYFFTHKYILFHIALPMMAFNIAGSFLGSKMAILKGNAFVRKLFLLIIAAVLLRFGWDIFWMFYRPAK